MRAIRHTMSPSIGYSWTPDFSKPLFGKDLGYIITEIDTTTGKEYFHDRFSGTMAGNTPRAERKSMNFGLNNVFQAKVKNGDKEKKVDLLSWRMSSSYNFAADSMHLANLRSSVRSKISGKLNLNLNMTHDFYKYDTDRNKRIAEYNKNENGFFDPRLTSARLSTGFRFSGKRWTERADTEIVEDTTDIEEDLAGPGLINPLKNRKNTLDNSNLWSTNVSLSYSYTATNPEDPRKTFWVNTNSSINVTEKWRVSYRARFDMIIQDLVSHSFSVHRDLHCWELSLNWTPSGMGQGINFKLNVKSPSLKDIKIEKKSGVFSGPRF